MTKGAFGSGASRALVFRPWAHSGHEEKVTAAAADVTQVQGVGVAWATITHAGRLNIWLRAPGRLCARAE
jgi:hypothetical protein